MEIEINPEYEAWQSSKVAATITAINIVRQWKEINGWTDWFSQWSEKCFTVPHALGLLHAIPLHEPRAIRFLVAATYGHDELRWLGQLHAHCDGHDPCPQREIERTAERILIFQFLKTPEDGFEAYIPNVSWWPVFKKDPLALAILIDWMLARRLTFMGSTGAWQAMRSFLSALARTADRSVEDDRRKHLRGLGNRFHKALIEYEISFPAEDDETVAALRSIAMGKDHWGETPASLDEAVLRSGVYGTAAKLVLEAEAKARGERKKAEREKQTV